MFPKFENGRKVIKVYLDETDYKWVELQAAGNVSGWCRERVLAGRSTHLPPDVSELVEVAIADFLPKPSPNICANCEHKRSRHGGFGHACQEDNCLCARFE